MCYSVDKIKRIDGYKVKILFTYDGDKYNNEFDTNVAVYVL